jgi:hypothetical protein
LVVLLAGCNGGTVDRHALANDSSTISSINCEGWLLARAVGRGRVTSNYASEHAEDLRRQAANLADALATRPADVGLRGRVRAAGRDAGLLASRLHRLRRHSSSRTAALELAQKFKAAGNCS